MVGYIYLTTDTTNGMQYVGQHHYNKEGELDPNYHGSGVIISRIYKERPETLKEEYIKTCYSDSEMNDDEKYYIKLYKTLWPNGYNLSEGGDGGVRCEETRRKISNSHKGLQAGEKHPNYGKHLSEETRRKISVSLKGKTPSEETRRKMSDSHKGKNLSEETKQKISEVKSGEKNPMFGKHHSEESKKKMSQNHYDCSGEKHPMFGKKHSEETRRKISNSHKGLQAGEKNPMYGKHHSEETKNKISVAKKGKNRSEETKQKLSKKVLQFSLSGEFIREWPSTAECGRNGFNQAHVSACCRGKVKSHKGFIFKFKI